jgi:hypothetical protein
MSSEEILIEKIKKEKEEVLRLKIINHINAEKVKTIVPNKPSIAPQPLTLIRPFNLSSNKMLMKKRITNTNVDELNSKITEAMKKKCEFAGEKLKESLFIHDKIILQKTPTNVKYMKKSLGRSKSKSPLRNFNLDEDLQSLSSRIEKYCVISGYDKVKSKSPLKLCFGNNNENEEKVFNSHINNIANFKNTSSTNNSNFFSNSTAIRRHFVSNNNNSLNTSTEEKIVKDMQSHKFKAKPLNRNIFSGNVSNLSKKKQPEIESFEMILQKTRMEKQEIDKKEKEKKKMNKINKMKYNNVVGKENKENVNTMNRGNMIIEH